MEIPQVAPEPAPSKAGIIVEVSEPVTRKHSLSIIHPLQSYSWILCGKDLCKAVPHSAAYGKKKGFITYRFSCPDRHSSRYNRHTFCITLLNSVNGRREQVNFPPKWRSALSQTQRTAEFSPAINSGSALRRKSSGSFRVGRIPLSRQLASFIN